MINVDTEETTEIYIDKMKKNIIVHVRTTKDDTVFTSDYLQQFYDIDKHLYNFSVIVYSDKYVIYTYHLLDDDILIALKSYVLNNFF